jgi:L-ascorbate metabolism protein UlaG (beta-lactamase superfamily)
MKITWFGHSCFRLDLGSSSILIDPFLTGNATFEEAGIPARQASKGVTHVALTHGHEDHLGDTMRICKETDAQLLAVHELATHIAGQGVDKIDPGNTGGTLYHADFDLTFVPAWHSASNIVDGRPVYLGACCGLVITPHEGKTVYHMGDTAIFSDKGLINELYRPEIGFVPIGDRYTMGARTAALCLQAFLSIGAGRAMPLRDVPGARSDCR